MPTIEEMRQELQEAKAAGWQPPPSPAPGVPTLEEMRAEVEAAKAQGWRPGRRETLSLKKTPVERALAFGTQTGGSPNPADTRTLMERIRATAASISEPWVESAAGIHELLGATPEQLAEYEAARGELARQAEGPGRTVGNIAGEVLQYALPGGVGGRLATKAATGLPRAVQRAAPLTGEAAGIGAFEAAATPGTAEERAAAGATGAGATLAGGLAGQGLARAVGRVAQPVRPTPQAEQLLERGYPLTPKQATAPGSMVGRAEDFLSHVPGWRGIERLRDVPIEKFQDDIWTSIHPATKGTRGTEAAQIAQRELGKGYDEVFESMTQVPTQNVTALRTSLMREGGPVNLLVGQFDDSTQQALTRFIDTKFQNLTRRNTPNTWQSTLTSLRDRATKYRKDGLTDEADVLERVQGSLERMLPRGTQDRLKDLNRRYRDLSVVQEAMRYQPSIEAGGQFSPVELLKASRKMGTPRQTAAGSATLQGESLEALNLSPGVATRRQLIGQPDIVPTAVMGGLGYLTGGPVGVAAVGGAGIPLAREGVRRALMGQTGLQNLLKWPGLQAAMADALRRYGGRAAAGYAANSED